LFEVPSNLILQRVGAKLWIARIMITWGLLSGATMFVQTPMQFYVVRFLLGAAEAGFLPGVLLYLTQWYPDARRARIVALFMVGLPLSSMIGSPISGWIMRAFDGVHGLGGWQWLFLLEALPSVLLGFAVLRWLPNRIESAQWLNDDEKRVLRANLDRDPSGNKSHALGRAFSDPKVWALGLIDLCVLLGLYAVSFWLPTILRDTGVKDAYHIGWLMVIPNAAAVLATLYCGASSDRARERRWHIVVPFVVSAVALAIAATSSHGTIGTVVLFSLINAGAAAAMPVVWALPSTFLKGSAAAGGIAFACSIANLGGFGSTYFIGWLRDTFHSQSAGLYAFAACMLIGCALALAYPAKLVNR
ncbi:MFS transporter, partial [Burkholderia multivorans]